MKTTKKGHLSKQDLATRWASGGVPISIRQVERTIRKYNLSPCDWHGREPEFHPADVAGMETRRKAAWTDRAMFGRVITIKEAKIRAGKGGAK